MNARTGHWIREGLRAGVFLPPRVAGQSPLPRQMLVIVLVAIVVELVLGRLEVPGEASFDARLWLASWWTVAASVLLVWALLSGARTHDGTPRPSGMASWFALWFMAAIPPSLFAQALTMLHARDALPPSLADSALFAWGSWILL